MRVLMTGLLLVLASPAFADDWPQWMGPKRDGVWRETGILTKFPAGGPRVRWEAKVGMGYAGPAVADGKVFLMDRLLDPGASNPNNPFDDKTSVPGAERVLCFEAATGKPLWQHSYPVAYRVSYASGPRCTPTVDGERVYTLGTMGHLLCLDSGSGKVLWEKNFIQDFGATVPKWGFSAHPLVDGDRLICLVGGTEGRLVMAFDTKTGQEKWRSLDYPSGDFGYAPPVIYELAGRRQVVIWHPKALVGLDPETGKRLWQVPFEARAALTAPMPRAERNRVFVTAFYNGSMLAEVTADGAKAVWKSKTKSEFPRDAVDLNSIIATPVFKDGHIYGVGGYGQLRCLEASSGKVLWETMKATRGRLTPEKLRDSEAPSEAQPWHERWANAFIIEQGDRYFLFNEQGELIIARMSPKGYEEIDRAVILQPTNRLAGRPVVWMHPAFAQKSLFARNDEKLVCVSLAAE